MIDYNGFLGWSGKINIFQSFPQREKTEKIRKMMNGMIA